ncbi:sensor histidine kinase [Actinoplanes sp. L3-i22]|uniref:sensor histidine kinase n=1 Tax=Actinoplanes sp. L3-i22 TaxID=2836373 RepID=UPI001C7994D1|nr:histidine kinase [Actinoplanes sp. L3-i22]BCY11507.1 two-component sensor histidine kinase [Actinoplanes sp. L3-i22]
MRPLANPLLAAGLAAPAMVAPPDGRPFWVQALVLAGLVLPLLGRHRRPAAMTAIVLAAAGLGLLTRAWAGHLPLAHLSLQVMLYTLVVRGRRRAALVAAPAAAAFYAVWSVSGWSALTYGLSIGTAWLLGEYVRVRRAYLRSLETRADLADSERRALARAAAAEERTRIARELHDVLAHSVSVMVVNAEGAQLMRHADPAAVDRTLALVSNVGRQALTELRRLLAMLGTDGPAAVPQPILTDLHRLAASVGGTAMRVLGRGDDVPPGAVVQTCRIVQEALTNVVKHAGTGAAVQVTVDLGEPGPGRTIRIEVGDRGGAAPARLPSSGRGLAGMRERVAMFGGTLDVGPRPGGGFRVLATLPLDPPGTARSQPVPGSIGACLHGC